MWNVLLLGIWALSFRLTVQKPTDPVIRYEVSTDEEVKFTSPGYEDGMYPDNTVMLWEFHSLSSKCMKLSFEDFDVEAHQYCIWDKVEIAKGRCDINAENEPTVLCGHIEKDYQFNCDDNFMCVSFHSDQVIHRRGFKATVSAQPDLTASGPSETNNKSENIVSSTQLPPQSAKSNPTITKSPEITSSSASTPHHPLSQTSSSIISSASTAALSLLKSSPMTSSSLPSSLSSSSSSSPTSSSLSSSPISSTSSSSSMSLSPSSPMSSSSSLIALFSSVSLPISPLPSPSQPSSSSPPSSSPSPSPSSSPQSPPYVSSLLSTLSNSPNISKKSKTMSGLQSTQMFTSSLKPTSISNKAKQGNETSSAKTPTSPSSTTISTTSEAAQTAITMCEASQTDVDLFDIETIIVRSPVNEFGKYPLNMTCSLGVHNKDNKTLQLVFSRFNLEYHGKCKWDFLKVDMLGADTHTFCGDLLPKTRETNSQLIDLVFHSDHVVADEGFELHITRLNTPTTVLPTSSMDTNVQSTTFSQVTESPSLSTSTTKLIDNASVGTTPATVSSSTESNQSSDYSTKDKNDPTEGITLTTTDVKEGSWQITSPATVNIVSSTTFNSNEASAHTLTHTIAESTMKLTDSTDDSSAFPTSNAINVDEPITSTLKQSSTSNPSDTTADSLESSAVDICNYSTIVVDREMAIVTPGFFGQKYPLNRKCTMSLTANSGYDIVLNVDKFELETHQKCAWDHVELEYNMTQIKLCGVLDSNSQPSPYNNCNPNRINVYDVGKSHPVCLFESGTSVNLKVQNINLTFFSDYIVNKSGFKINVVPLISNNNNTDGPKLTSSTYKEYSSAKTTTVGVTSNLQTESTSSDYTTPSKVPVTSTESTLASYPTSSSVSADISIMETIPITTSKSNGILLTDNSPSVTFNHSTVSSASGQTSETTTPSTNDESKIMSTSNGLSETTPTITTAKVQETHITDACSGHGPMLLDGETGFIESPGYLNNNYPQNSSCRWKITGAKEKVVMIVFETFDVEYSLDCMWDKLTFYEIQGDGSTLKNAWTKCGNVIPDLLSFKKDILVEFISDSVTEKAGFRLKYYIIETNKDTNFTCPAGMMPCLDTETCIPAEWWCDRMIDCEDQTDESSCDLCGEDEFQCVNGTCISSAFRCDGTEHCPYGTDERSCVSISAAEDNLPVLVNVQNEWLPLCYENSVANRSDDICNAAGYRSSLEQVANKAHDFDSYSNIDVGSQSLAFVASAKCPENRSVQLRCSESECGKRGEVSRQKRIVGGNITMKGVWRWSVALRIGNSVVCGGSIISSVWVMTAGHCVHGLEDNPQVLSIIAGVNDITEYNSEIRYVSEVVIHPKYNFIFDADIALLRLQSPLIFNDDIQPICLPWDRRQFSPLDICYITGYGVSDIIHYFTTVKPRYLRQVKTKIMDHKTCRKMYSYKTVINDRMICAGYAVGEMDACKGDSGGGLMCQSENGRWMLAGVVSWGDMCGSRSRPGVYTNVVSYLDWIREISNPDGLQSLACDFENNWCGYKDISAGNYIWTRKPGDKYVKGTVLYAAKTSASSNDKVTNASLLSPAFTLTTDSCLSFRTMFSGNSNVTVTLYGKNRDSLADQPDTPLFAIISHYPATDIWKSVDINIPSRVTQLLFVSHNDDGGISGLGLDNITMVTGTCQGSEFMECDFDNADLCQYTQSYGQNTAQWVISPDTDGNYLETGGEYEDFGYTAVSQLISPAVSTKYISIPHCLTFSYNKQSDTNTELVVSTYVTIVGELANQQIYWSSENSEIGQWVTKSVTIPHNIFNHVVFEVRRKFYTTDVVKILLDDIKIVDGMCVYM